MDGEANANKSDSHFVVDKPKRSFVALGKYGTDLN